MKKMWCVVYRTGGKMNPKWKRTSAQEELTDAHAICDQIKTMGYHAMTVDYQLSMSVGLPEGYEYNKQ